MNLIRLILLGIVLVLVFAIDVQESFGFPYGYTVSAQGLALAPNAGGQRAWSLRLAENDQVEYSLFVNEYLVTGSVPLTGVSYGWRYSLCGRICPLRMFAQLGAGVSTAGPVVEVIWSVTPLWLLRVDIATHFYFLTDRAILWSYPFWLGVSVPI